MFLKRRCDKHPSLFTEILINYTFLPSYALIHPCASSNERDVSLESNVLSPPTHYPSSSKCVHAPAWLGPELKANVVPPSPLLPLVLP